MPDEEQQTTEDDSIAALGDSIAEIELENPPEEAEEGEESDAQQGEEDKDEPVEVQQDEETEDELPELAASIEELAKQIGVDAPDLLGLDATVKVNGEDRTIPISEALKHFAEHGHAEGQIEQLDQRKAALDQAETQARDAWTKRFEQLDSLLNAVTAQLAGEEDFEHLLSDGDTEGYLTAKAAAEKRQKAIDTTLQERTRLLGEQQQQTQTSMAEVRNREQQALIRAIPELQNAEKQVSFEREMSASLAQYGFSTQEVSDWLGGAFNHRAMLILRDATAHRNGKAKVIEAKTKKRLKALPRVRRPGPAKSAEDEGRDRTGEIKKRVRNAGGNDPKANAALFGDY